MMLPPDQCFMTVIIIGISFIFLQLLRKYWNSYKHGSLLLNIRKPSNIIIIEDVESCDKAIQDLESKIAKYPVVGMDCEWVCKVRKHPVALLQLATSDGLCMLIRLYKLSYISTNLIRFLQNSSIIKVGSAVTSDASWLRKDYQIDVSGCVNIDAAARMTGFTGGSLKRMAENVLNLFLDKNKSVQCSDWEADQLSDVQMNYAALDALIPLKILEQVMKTKVERINLYETEAWCHFLDLWADIIDETHSCKSRPQKKSIVNENGNEKSVGIKGLLYENCFLQDPQGNVLCVCNNKKLNWYIEKDLGVEVSSSPRVVRLKFQPKQFERNEDSLYYMIEKDNKCVVCGGTSFLRRKNIVPNEYRRHFPNIMKDYKSHDVILLCSLCHRRSVLRDGDLRKELSIKCNAPIVQTCLSEEARMLIKLKYTAKALLQKKFTISQPRIDELKNIIFSHEKCDKLTDQLLLDIMSRSVPKSIKLESHGEKVVKYFREKKTLNELEFIWRSHFVDKMNPKHLPNLWSISHNPWREKN